MKHAAPISRSEDQHFIQAKIDENRGLAANDRVEEEKGESAEGRQDEQNILVKE